MRGGTSSGHPVKDAIDRWQQGRPLTAIPCAVAKKFTDDGASRLAAVIAYFVLPLLGFVVVLFAGMWQQPVIAMVGFPIAFAGASVVVCALLNLSTAVTLLTGLACWLSSFILCGVAFLLGVVGSFFSGF